MGRPPAHMSLLLLPFFPPLPLPTAKNTIFVRIQPFIPFTTQHARYARVHGASVHHLSNAIDRADEVGSLAQALTSINSFFFQHKDIAAPPATTNMSALDRAMLSTLSL